MSTGNTDVTGWKRTRPRSKEGKHPVGRTNVTKTEDPRRIRETAAKRRRKRSERSRWQTGYRVASFLHNLARQPREKLVLPSPGPRRCKRILVRGRVRDARNTL